MYYYKSKKLVWRFYLRSQKADTHFVKSTIRNNGVEWKRLVSVI